MGLGFDLKANIKENIFISKHNSELGWEIQKDSNKAHLKHVRVI